MLKTKECIEENSKYVRNYLRKLCNDESLIEDIVQETLVARTAYIDKFDERSKLETWLCTIAKHKLYKHYKKNKLYKTIPIEEMENEFALDMNETIEEAYEHKEEREELYKYISCLDEPEHTIVILRIQENMGFREIAEKFGKSENWSRQKFHKAKGKMIEMRRGEKYEKEKN